MKSAIVINALGFVTWVVPTNGGSWDRLPSIEPTQHSPKQTPAHCYPSSVSLSVPWFLPRMVNPQTHNLGAKVYEERLAF